MIDAAGLVLLAVSGAISFALGRTVVHFRRKKRDRLAQEAQATQELALRNRPPEPPSKNKSKRKRQLQQEQQQVKPR